MLVSKLQNPGVSTPQRDHRLFCKAVKGKSIGESRDVECVDTAPTIVSKGGKGILTSSCAVRVRCAIDSRLSYGRKHTAELFITKPAGIVPRT